MASCGRRSRGPALRVTPGVSQFSTTVTSVPCPRPCALSFSDHGPQSAAGSAAVGVWTGGGMVGHARAHASCSLFALLLNGVKSSLLSFWPVRDRDGDLLAGSQAWRARGQPRPIASADRVGGGWHVVTSHPGWAVCPGGTFRPLHQEWDICLIQHSSGLSLFLLSLFAPSSPASAPGKTRSAPRKQGGVSSLGPQHLSLPGKLVAHFGYPRAAWTIVI